MTFRYYDLREFLWPRPDHLEAGVDGLITGFDSSTVLRIVRRLHNADRNVVFVVDFSKINNVIDPIEDSLKIGAAELRSCLKDRDSGVIFVGLPTFIATKLQNSSLKTLPHWSLSEGGLETFGYGCRQECWNPAKVTKLREEWKDALATRIDSSWTPFPGNSEQRLPSTPVRASGFYNAQRIIADSEMFTRAAIIMANFFSEEEDALETKRATGGFQRIMFLGLSLRSSPFVGALSMLCDRGFSMIGPGINSRILNEFIANPLSPRSLRSGFRFRCWRDRDSDCRVVCRPSSINCGSLSLLRERSGPGKLRHLCANPSNYKDNQQEHG